MSVPLYYFPKKYQCSKELDSMGNVLRNLIEQFKPPDGFG